MFMNVQCILATLAGSTQEPSIHFIAREFVPEIPSSLIEMELLNLGPEAYGMPRITEFNIGVQY